jgi:RNA polymerase sigma factor (TIGR02999 family)
VRAAFLEGYTRVTLLPGRDMVTPPSENVTALLRAWGQGDREAGERLMPLIYQELRRQAARSLRRERRDHTLPPTAVVHETYLRLVGERAPWVDRAHFFGVASRVMRQVLVDHARRRGAAKRGGSWTRVSLEGMGTAASTPAGEVDVILLDQALAELAQLDAEKARVVELRFFGGLKLEETAETLGVSASTVTREWRMARAWLRRWIAASESAAQAPGTRTRAGTRRPS